MLQACMTALVALFRDKRRGDVVNWSVVQVGKRKRERERVSFFLCSTLRNAQVAALLPGVDGLRDVLVHDLGLDASVVERCVAEEAKAAVQRAQSMADL